MAAGEDAAPPPPHSQTASVELVQMSLESITMINSKCWLTGKHAGAPVLSHTPVRIPLPKSAARDEIVVCGYVPRELA